MAGLTLARIVKNSNRQKREKQARNNNLERFTGEQMLLEISGEGACRGERHEIYRERNRCGIVHAQKSGQINGI
jgi:hypothetical protein